MLVQLSKWRFVTATCHVADELHGCCCRCRCNASNNQDNNNRTSHRPLIDANQCGTPERRDESVYGPTSFLSFHHVASWLSRTDSRVRERATLFSFLCVIGCVRKRDPNDPNCSLYRPCNAVGRLWACVSVCDEQQSRNKMTF